MSEPYCRSILDECGASWYRMVTLIAFVKKVTAIIRAVSPETAVSVQSKSFTKAISKFANILKIKETFESCGNFETCPFSKVSLLCESFITFVGNSYLTAVATRSVPELMGMSLSPSGEVKEINEQLDFLIHSADVIFKKNNANSSKNRKKFFRKVMDKKAVLKYLRDIGKNIEKLRSRIMQLTDNLKLTIPGIDPRLINIMDKWITRLKRD